MAIPLKKSNFEYLKSENLLIITSLSYCWAVDAVTFMCQTFTCEITQAFPAITYIVRCNTNSNIHLKTFLERCHPEYTDTYTDTYTNTYTYMYTYTYTHAHTYTYEHVTVGAQHYKVPMTSILRLCSIFHK